MQKLSKRTLASRANGKLSRGPVSAAGKLRASANSTRHGLLAQNLVLDDESKDVFALLHQQFIDRLNPTDGMEIYLVEELAATAWRQRRLLAIETNLFKEAAAKRPEETCLGRIGGAFSDLARAPEIHLLDRYESRLHRMFQRTLKNLELLRQIEHTEPSTGELTQLPARYTATPHAPAKPVEPEIPNEPNCEEPRIESETYPVSLNPDCAPAGNAEGASPQPALAPEVPALPTQEPGSRQPQPITCIRKPEPVDPYANYPRFEIDPRNGALKRIA